MNNKIKKFAWVNKEGAIIGGLLGVGLWYLGWSSFIPVKNTWLNLIIMILILGIGGVLIDSFYEPNK